MQAQSPLALGDGNKPGMGWTRSTVFHQERPMLRTVDTGLHVHVPPTLGAWTQGPLPQAAM